MKPANGELRSTTDGLVARITIKGRHRESFLLWGNGDEAKARRKLVAGVAVSFRRAGVVGQPEAIKLLRTIAAATPAVLDGALAVAAELAGGELVRDDQAPRPVVTFRQLGERWTSGKLHSEFPDHVKEKDGAQDASRLAKLCAIDVGGMALGDVPVTSLTVDHAERVMGDLPEAAKRPATRRQYIQVLHRVLALAVYPCRLIQSNPLPKGFVPMPGKPPAYPYLYPSEDEALMGTIAVPLSRRVLFGFLAREGCRISEAAASPSRIST